MLRIAIICTNCSQLGSHKTGAWLSEISHAYEVFRESAADIEFLSPAGGMIPLEGIDFSDPANKNLLHTYQLLWTVPITWREPSDYEVVYFAGGHGAMGDFPALYDWASKVKIIGAVCHGVAVLTGGPKLCNAVSCFTDEEEILSGVLADMPFSLETKLRSIGYDIEKAAPWQPKVVVSSNGRVITGQNPASARTVAQQIMLRLNFRWECQQWRI